jgi:hypothetical protein
MKENILNNKKSLFIEIKFTTIKTILLKPHVKKIMKHFK